MADADDLGQSSADQMPSHNSAFQRWGRLVIGTALSLLFLFLALRGVNLGEVWATLRRANLVYVALALAFSTGVNVAKGIRWQVILRPYAPAVSLRRLFAVLMIGQGMNTFAPLRVGDIARAYLVKGVGVATVLYSVVVEKALDSLTLIGLLFAVTLVMPVPAWLKQSGVLLSLGLVALLLVLILAGRGSRHLVGGGAWLERAIPPLHRLGVARRVENAAGVLRSLSQGHVLLPAVGWTAVCWVLGIAANLILLPALGLQVTWPVLAATFLIIVLYLGAIVPSSPGKVGIFHYLCVISLALFAVDKTPALAYAIVLHLVSYCPPAILGAYYVWRESQARGQR